MQVFAVSNVVIEEDVDIFYCCDEKYSFVATKIDSRKLTEYK
jgi:hypothetical protein